MGCTDKIPIVGPINKLVKSVNQEGLVQNMNNHFSEDGIVSNVNEQFKNGVVPSILQNLDEQLKEGIVPKVKEEFGEGGLVQTMKPHFSDGGLLSNLNAQFNTGAVPKLLKTMNGVFPALVVLVLLFMVICFVGFLLILSRMKGIEEMLERNLNCGSSSFSRN